MKRFLYRQCTTACRYVIAAICVSSLASHVILALLWLRTPSSYHQVTMERRTPETAMYHPSTTQGSMKLINSTGYLDTEQNVTEQVTRICSQAERLSHVKNTCQRLKIDKGRMPNFHSYERHKMLYCSITKVGSTSWLSLMLYAKNATNSSWPAVHNHRYMKENGIVNFGTLTKDERQYRIDNYFKWIIVRHPLERLVSSWRDKFYIKNSPYRKKGLQIIDKYRLTNTTVPSEYEDTCRFEEFAQYLYDTHKHDMHWVSYNRRCAVCSVDWDAILRIETHDQDAHIILDRLSGYTGPVPFIHSHSDNKKFLFSPIKNVKRYYENVTEDAMRYILSVYGMDIELFGYKWDDKKYDASCKIPTAEGKYCC